MMRGLVERHVAADPLPARPEAAGTRGRRARTSRPSLRRARQRPCARQRGPRARVSSDGAGPDGSGADGVRPPRRGPRRPGTMVPRCSCTGVTPSGLPAHHPGHGGDRGAQHRHGCGGAPERLGAGLSRLADVLPAPAHARRCRSIPPSSSGTAWWSSSCASPPPWRWWPRCAGRRGVGTWCGCRAACSGGVIGEAVLGARRRLHQAQPLRRHDPLHGGDRPARPTPSCWPCGPGRDAGAARAPSSKVARRERRVSQVMLVLLAVVVAAGTATTGAGPHAGGRAPSACPSPLADMARVHSGIVLCLVALTLVALYLLDRTGAPDVGARPGPLCCSAPWWPRAPSATRSTSPTCRPCSWACTSSGPPWCGWPCCGSRRAQPTRGCRRRRR